jgi:hypothetical protein
MDLDSQKFLDRIKHEDTDDLLDSVTAFRAGMEPEAIEMIESELRRRGVNSVAIDEYAQTVRAECLFETDRTAKMCSFCRKPAVAEGWGWHKILGRWLPIFPRWVRYCKKHAPATSTAHPRPSA